MQRHCTRLIVAIGLSTGALQGALAAPARMEDPIVHVPAFDLSQSALLSLETKAVLTRQSQEFAKIFGEICPAAQDVLTHRKCLDEHYYPQIIARQRKRYPVLIEPRSIGAVPTEIISPAGTSLGHRDRVLINLHGGGFVQGGRLAGQIESIPIAALGRIKIVSVDYRMAPEHLFPAASEDVAAVYRALLRDYDPRNIGIYGCSAGGMLAAQSVVWFRKQDLPVPGAIGIFCAGIFPNTSSSDSARLVTAVTASNPPRSSPASYFTRDDLKNAFAFPGLDPTWVTRFPPSLLITGTRDYQMSSTVATHAMLVRSGVQADLHVWEGMAHGFLFEPDLPESREAYGVIVRFFDDHLGAR